MRGFAERTAVNTPLQGTAADLIKLAMIHIDQELRSRKLKSRMLLQVHDELLFEVPQAEIEAMRELVREKMESVHTLERPVAGGAGRGTELARRGVTTLPLAPAHDLFQIAGVADAVDVPGAHIGPQKNRIARISSAQKTCSGSITTANR